MRILKVNSILLIFLFLLVFQGCREKDEVRIQENSNSKIDYLREVIVRETFQKQFPEGAEKSFEDFMHERIYKEAQDISIKLDNAIPVWNAPNLTSEQYYEAAKIIVQNLELNEGQFLTFGNILRVLGYPSSIEKIGYYFDVDHNIEQDSTRFYIQYVDNKVKLSFTVSGFLDSIMFYKESQLQTIWTGCGPIHWPQKYTYSNSTPVIAGKFEDSQFSNKLLKSIVKRLSNSYSQSDWLNFMLYSEVLKKQDPLKSEQKAVKVAIILIDGITGELAKGYFKITGPKSFYCDTWWQFKNDEWQMIPTKQAEAILCSGK